MWLPGFLSTLHHRAPGPEPPSEQCNVKEGRSLQGTRLDDAQLPESTDLTQAIYML